MRFDYYTKNTGSGNLGYYAVKVDNIRFQNNEPVTIIVDDDTSRFRILSQDGVIYIKYDGICTEDDFDYFVNFGEVLELDNYANVSELSILGYQTQRAIVAQYQNGLIIQPT